MLVNGRPCLSALFQAFLSPYFTSWIKVWYLPFSQDPAEGAWEHLAKVQQLLEDKEQALAILQETVQVWPSWVLLPRHPELQDGESEGPAAFTVSSFSPVPS